MKKWIVALALVALAPGAFAQNYPDRVITLVAPFPPGGPSDTTARMIVGPMAKALGQQIVVENVTGAGGTIGTNRVAKAKPDGYTLMVSGSGTHAAAEFLNKDLPYRSTDFEQIGLINISPVVLVARSAVPANTLKEFVAFLQANEKKVTEARRRRRLDLQSRLLGVPFGRRRAPDGRFVSRHAAGHHGSGCRQCRLRLQPDRQHRAAYQDRQAQGLCGDQRQALADAAGRADHRRSRHAAVQPHGLVRPVGAEGHAAPDRRQAQQGARTSPCKIPTWSSGLPISATTSCRPPCAVPTISTSSTKTKSRCGRRCSAVWACGAK